MPIVTQPDGRRLAIDPAPTAQPGQPTGPTSDLGKSIMATPIPTESAIGSITLPTFDTGTGIATTGSPLDAYLQNAAKVLGPAYGQMFTGFSQEAQAEKGVYETLAQQQLGRKTLVQQTYANLADELSNTYKIQLGQAAQIGEQNIGGARASLAAAGVEGSAQGAFQAPVVAAQGELMKSITSLSNTYNINTNKLVSEMNNSLQDLQDKADQYRLQGQEKVAQLYDKMAAAKVQYTESVFGYAQKQKAADVAQERWSAEQAAAERRHQDTLRLERERLYQKQGKEDVTIDEAAKEFLQQLQYASGAELDKFSPKYGGQYAREAVRDRLRAMFGVKAGSKEDKEILDAVYRKHFSEDWWKGSA